ncbi:MAG TPA: acyltransferase [Syntrophus sp. (in: bacteria)]|nr:acyltransferase [Syntrophus sp. (in: bacteria)]
MKHCGKNFKFENGVRFEHPEFVDISDDVTINSHAWFSIIPIKGGVDAPSLKIGKGTYIGRFATIACINRIVIGDDVLISDRVFISDALHGYSDITRPVLCQPLYSPGPVEIGSGTWIGIGVSILPNVRIGENCVIGANAVVTCDVPDYHVAVGVPAHIVGRVDRCRG